MKTRLFFTAVAFVAISVIASAQTTGQTDKPAGQGKAQGAAWVDANNNGVCDNYESGARQGRGQGNSQGQALHNGRGRGNGQGMAAGRGQARGNGQGRYNGRGPAFVDANKDGVCDNLTPVEKK
ncbi:MAG: hypothetical protein WAV93_03135 [Bacteroidales bacterium]